GNGVRHRQLLAERIDMHTIDLKLIVQVRPGRQPCSADIANDLPLLDVSAVTDALGKALHMGIKRSVALAMLDDYGVAIAAMASCQADAAITCSLDRRATRCCIVHAFMSTDLVQDGVLAASG